MWSEIQEEDKIRMTYYILILSEKQAWKEDYARTMGLAYCMLCYCALLKLLGVSKIKPPKHFRRLEPQIVAQSTVQLHLHII